MLAVDQHVVDGPGNGPLKRVRTHTAVRDLAEGAGVRDAGVGMHRELDLVLKIGRNQGLHGIDLVVNPLQIPKVGKGNVGVDVVASALVH